MGENYDRLSDKIQSHLKQIIKTSGLPDTEDALDLMAKGWLGKEQAFEEQVTNRNMEVVDSVSKDEELGFVVMTYSGSLLTFGPGDEGGRSAEYVSIGMRQDVPDTAKKEESILAEDVQVDDVVSFESGPIKQSSAVFKIAVVQEDLEPEEQNELLAEVTQVLTEDFLEVNKTTMAETEDLDQDEE